MSGEITILSYPYELSGADWKFVRLLLPASLLGCKPLDIRQVLNEIVWKFRTGTAWRRALPETYGQWATLQTRFRRWAMDGTSNACSEPPTHRPGGALVVAGLALQQRFAIPAGQVPGFEGSGLLFRRVRDRWIRVVPGSGVGSGNGGRRLDGGVAMLTSTGHEHGSAVGELAGNGKLP